MPAVLSGWSGTHRSGNLVVGVKGATERGTRIRARRWALENVEAPVRLVSETPAVFDMEAFGVKDYSYEFEVVEEGV